MAWCSSAVTAEDQAGRIADAEKMGDASAGVVVAISGANGELVGAAVRVGVVVLIEVAKGVEDDAWLLRCCGGVAVVKGRVGGEERKIASRSKASMVAGAACGSKLTIGGGPPL